MASNPEAVVYIYLDDILCFGKTKGDCVRFTHSLRERLVELGWTLNWAKCTNPSKHFQWLGWVWDTPKALARPCKERRIRLHSLAKTLSTRTHCNLRELQSLHGMVSSMSLLDCGVMRHSREIAQLIRVHGPEGPWERNILSPKDVCKSLMKYASRTPWTELKPKHPEWVLQTDASPTGWGVVVEKCPDWYSGPMHGYGHWPPELAEARIELLELKAAGYGVDFPAVAGASHAAVVVKVDSTVAQSYLHRLKSGRIKSLHKVTEGIAKVACKQHLTVFAERVSTKDNLADSWSRVRKEPGHVSLCPQIYKEMCKTMGVRLSLDGFANRWNSKCPKYCSRFPDPSSLGNFFHLSPLELQQHTPFINPPWTLWPSVASHLLGMLHHMPVEWTCLCLLPQWTTRQWYKRLVNSATQTLHVPSSDSMYKDCLGEPFPAQPWHSVCLVLQGRHTGGRAMMRL